MVGGFHKEQVRTQPATKGVPLEPGRSARLIKNFTPELKDVKTKLRVFLNDVYILLTMGMLYTHLYRIKLINFYPLFG